MNTNTAVTFMLQYATFQIFGYSKEHSFYLTGKEFKRKISAIKLTRRIDKPDSRTYYFIDGTSCCYQDNQFKIKS